MECSKVLPEFCGVVSVEVGVITGSFPSYLPENQTIVSKCTKISVY